jgi:hypothetical protein
MIETIFDSLNAKAAIVAIEDVFEAVGRRVPVMISVTFADKSGRNLSGQTLGAFWSSVAHAKPLSVGLNCGLGAEEVRPYVEELSDIADTFTSVHPNAGLPNAFGVRRDPRLMRGGASSRVGLRTWSAAAAAPTRSTSGRSSRRSRPAPRAPVFTRSACATAGSDSPSARDPVRDGRRAHQHHRKIRARSRPATGWRGGDRVEQVRGGANIMTSTWTRDRLEAVMTRFLN